MKRLLKSIQKQRHTSQSQSPPSLQQPSQHPLPRPPDGRHSSSSGNHHHRKATTKVASVRTTKEDPNHIDPSSDNDAKKVIEEYNDDDDIYHTNDEYDHDNYNENYRMTAVIQENDSRYLPSSPTESHKNTIVAEMERYYNDNTTTNSSSNSHSKNHNHSSNHPNDTNSNHNNNRSSNHNIHNHHKNNLPHTHATTTTTDETRELVKQFIADIWNRGALDMIPKLCSPSLRFNGNTGTWCSCSFFLVLGSNGVYIYIFLLVMMK
jgi:hypothetical protein